MRNNIPSPFLFKVGVCIINSDKKIVSVGYNGMPLGLSDDEMPWTKGKEDPLQNKYLYGEFCGNPVSTLNHIFMANRR